MKPVTTSPVSKTDQDSQFNQICDHTPITPDVQKFITDYCEKRLNITDHARRFVMTRVLNRLQERTDTSNDPLNARVLLEDLNTEFQEFKKTTIQVLNSIESKMLVDCSNEENVAAIDALGVIDINEINKIKE